MTHAGTWTIDELAANRLLADLKLEATPERLASAAGHFAQHRQDISSWTAERALANIAQRLEAVSAHSFSRASDQWTQGYCFAEQQALTMTPEEILGLDLDRARSKGQVLRTMIKQARIDPS